MWHNTPALLHCPGRVTASSLQRCLVIQNQKRPSLECPPGLLHSLHCAAPVASPHRHSSSSSHGMTLHLFLVGPSAYGTSLIFGQCSQTSEHIKTIWRTSHKHKFPGSPLEILIWKTWNEPWEPEFLSRTPVIWAEVAYKPQVRETALEGVREKGCPPWVQVHWGRLIPARYTGSRGTRPTQPTISPKLLYHFLSRVLDERHLASVQFSRSVASDCLQPHESQHARPPCPSPTSGVHPDSLPSSRWCHPAISSSVVPFSSCPQSLPASESFPMSQLFTWGGQCIGVSASASVFPMNTQDWSPLGWTGWIFWALMRGEGNQRPP